MSNIYLRVPYYVAAFTRAVGDGESLPPSVPVVFSSFSEEYSVLVNGLRIVPESKQHYASCYSQSAWQNMLRGRMPQGGKVILNRNPTEWLTYAEVCTLERLTNTTRREAYEFLCIELPREMFAGGRVVRPNKSYSLDSGPANHLRRLLRLHFVRKYLSFEKKNRIFAEEHHLHRSNYEILERFLMEYNIPVSHDQRERKTLKRQLMRWRKELRHSISVSDINNDITITRIDKRELRHNGDEGEDEEE